MSEPKCYNCKHRGEIPGDAHSCCRHPLVNHEANPFSALMLMLQGKNAAAEAKLNIRGNPIGIRRGWFLWPANFDPVWLLNCDGFESKESHERT